MKCGFIDCEETSDEEFLLIVEDSFTFKSQVCSNHVMTLLRMHEDTVLGLVNSGIIVGDKDYLRSVPRV